MRPRLRVDPPGCLLLDPVLPITDAASRPWSMSAWLIEMMNLVNRLGTGERASRTAASPAGWCPRAQMAALLVRVQEFLTGQELPPPPPRFADITTSVHRENIEKAAAGGLVQGTSPVIFEPDTPTHRAQAASFLARELQALVEAGVLSPRG